MSVHFRILVVTILFSAAGCHVHHVGIDNEHKERVSLRAAHHEAGVLDRKAHYLITFKRVSAPKSKRELREQLGGHVEIVPLRSYKVFTTLRKVINLQDRWSISHVERLKPHHKRGQCEGHHVLHVLYSDEDSSEDTVVRLLKRTLATASIHARIKKITGVKYNVHLEDASKAGSAVDLLQNIEEVRFVSDAPQGAVLNHIATRTIQSDDGKTPMWDAPLGPLAGRNQIIMVADTGVDSNSCFFKDPNNGVTIFPKVNMNHRKIVSYRQHVNEFNGATDSIDGHGHGTHVCGSLAGDPSGVQEQYKGLAHDSKVFVTDLSQGAVGSLDVPIDLFTFYDASYLMGVRVSHNSWGARRPSTYVSIDGETDEYIFEHSDYVVVAAAGNGGKAEGVLSPATAKNIISVGAHMNSLSDAERQNIGTFSAVGPTFDQRIKPDIVAPGGKRVYSAKAAVSGDSCDVSFKYGTSMAAPFVSASVAILRQYFLEGWYPSGRKGGSASINPSGTLLKALIIHSGRKLSGKQGSTSIAGSPNNYQGWGALSLADIVYLSQGEGSYPKTHLALLQNQTIIQDGMYAEDFEVFAPSSASKATGVRVTLVWNDPPAAVGATKALVNDLDLVLQLPDGTLKYANSRSSYDDVNVVEQIDLPDGGAGVYRAMVYGRHVVEFDPYEGVPFSVVITGPSVKQAKYTAGCPNNCNGANGDCTATGARFNFTCLCNSKFHHVDCGVCDSEVHCSGNGQCGSDGVCTCEGNYEGDTCSKCKAGWYGSDCSMDCSCNGHGSCIGSTTETKYCVCEGNWGGEDCSVCVNGFRGPTCEIPSHFCVNRGVVAVEQEQRGYIQINSLGHYDNSVVCKWTIRAPDPSMRLKLTFIEFDIEADYDHVFVYNGTFNPGHHVAVWDGTKGMGKVLETGSLASIEFESDLEGPKTGFTMEFEVISPKGCTIETCNGKGTCATNSGPFACSCDENYDPMKYCSACVPGMYGTGCGFKMTPAPTNGPPSEVETCNKDGKICSGDGICDPKTKKCNCLHSVGTFCEIDCPGKASTPPSKCSGHGTCDLPGRCTCDEGHTGFACQLSTTNVAMLGGYMREMLRGEWILLGIDDTASSQLEIIVKLEETAGDITLGLWDDAALAGLTRHSLWKNITSSTEISLVLNKKEPNYVFGLYMEGTAEFPKSVTIRSKAVSGFDTEELLLPNIFTKLAGAVLVQLATPSPPLAPASYDFLLPIGISFLCSTIFSVFVVYLVVRHRRKKTLTVE